MSKSPNSEQFFTFFSKNISLGNLVVLNPKKNIYFKFGKKIRSEYTEKNRVFSTTLFHHQIKARTIRQADRVHGKHFKIQRVEKQNELSVLTADAI